MDNARFLLISGTESIHWERTLRAALTSLGALEISSRSEASELIGRNDYALVFIDATAIVEVAETIRDIRGQRRALPIIVAAASTDWAQAREVFRAGATDYVRKSHDHLELLSVTRAVMDQSARFDP